MGNSRNQETRSNKSEELFLSALSGFMTLISIGISLYVLLPINRSSLDRTNIDILKLDIQKAISNGAGLDVVDSITIENSVSTAELLDDIRIDLFVTDSVDKDLIDRVSVLIEENKESDPFNVLNEEQRYLFENIRIKSGDNYPEIESDVNRIVTSLKERNDLVTRYLAASESSARLAWFAAVLAVISVIPVLSSMIATVSSSVGSLYRRVRERFISSDENANDLAEPDATDESIES